MLMVHEYNSREKVRDTRTLKIFISILLIIFLIEIVYYFFITPNLVIKSIYIQAPKEFGLSNREVLDLAGIGDERGFFQIDSTLIQQRLEAYHTIAQASVSKTFPDTLDIQITLRNASVLTFLNTSGASLPIAVDRDGIVFQIGEEVQDFTLPVLSGIKFNQLRRGMQLPQEIVSLIRDLERIKQENPVAYRQISEIRLQKIGEQLWDAVLYPVNYQIEVNIGNSLDVISMGNILTILDAASDEGLLDQWEALDIRTGTIVYRLREAQDG
jgi:cell division septal protein FtsQ